MPMRVLEATYVKAWAETAEIQKNAPVRRSAETKNFGEKDVVGRRKNDSISVYCITLNPPASKVMHRNCVMSSRTIPRNQPFSTIKFPRTRTSMPLRMKVLYAFSGEVTIGSPFKLNDVFMSIGMPVFSSNFLISFQ